MQEEAERFDSMVSMGEGVPKAVGEGCGGWRQGTAGDGSRDHVPLPDQSGARGKGTPIEMITKGVTTMRQNEASKPHCYISTCRIGSRTENKLTTNMSSFLDIFK